MSIDLRWLGELNALRAAGRERRLCASSGIDFSSNDYLGYGKRTFADSPRLPRSGIASRLLNGHHGLWDEVEAALAAWHGAEAALVMSSGYAANEGLLRTIVGPDDVVFSDAANHASIIEGVRLAKARHIFRHNDLNQLEDCLRQAAPHDAKTASF